MANTSQKYNLKIKKRDSWNTEPSAFVVDLRQKKVEEIFKEPQPDRTKELKKAYLNQKIKTKISINIFFSKIKSRAQKLNLFLNKKIYLGRLIVDFLNLIFTKIAPKFKIRKKLYFPKFIIKFKNYLSQEYLIFKQTHGGRIARLTFPDFIFFIIFFIKRLSFNTGWVSLFFARFVWFFSRDIAENIIQKGNQIPVLGQEIKLSQEQKFRFKIFREKIIGYFVNIFSALNKEFELSDFLPRLNFKILKPAFAFAIVLLIFVLPLKAFTYYSQLDLQGKKARIVNFGEDGLNDFARAAKSISAMDFKEAQENFNQAGESFLEAQRQLDSINNGLLLIASYIPQKEAKMAGQSREILAAGKTAADLGNNLSLAIDSLLNREENSIGEALSGFNKFARVALEEAKILNFQLAQIDLSILKEDYQNQFNSLKGQSLWIEKSLGQIIDLSGALYEILGPRHDKRYLLVFQNNTELRAPGGFIGSYALVDFNNGAIKNLETPGGGSYDTEGGMRVLVEAPKPLHLVNPLWHFWDANWWPDWPTSARKLAWFYEKSDGPTVDGVISFTPTVFENFLRIIGPVEMPDYNLTITADNFWENVQQVVERKSKDPEMILGEIDKPKKIIGDLMEKILADLPAKLNSEKLISLIKVLEQSLKEKHILAYFNDAKIQEEAKKLGWDGAIREANNDYLAVINTNIAGGKSDKRIEEIISHKAEILADGSIVDTLEITRKHNGLDEDLFSGVRNVDWVRVYVPKGSELLEASGFRVPDEVYFEEPDDDYLKDSELEIENQALIDQESQTKIYTESNKTVFANWSMVDRGQTATLKFKYKLPFKLSFSAEEKIAPYSLLAQKQSGSKGSAINSALILPANFKVIWKYPENFIVQEDGWGAQDKLNIDKYWAVLIKHN